jgi:hypothetical protein
MKTEQWDVGDFEQHNPLFQTRYGELALLGVAVLPFTIGLSYLGVRRLSEYVGAALWDGWVIGGTSVVAGAVLAAVVCTMVIEWMKHYHYEQLRKRSDPLSRCMWLLSQAIDDRDTVKSWLKYDAQKYGLLERLRAVAKKRDGGLEVERLEDEVVFRLIDRWIRNTKHNREIAVVSAEFHDIRGSCESRLN